MSKPLVMMKKQLKTGSTETKSKAEVTNLQQRVETTALMEAAATGGIDKVKEILALNPESVLEIDHNGNNALMYAVANFQLNIVLLLLSSKYAPARQMIINDAGETLLIKACQKGFAAALLSGKGGDKIGLIFEASRQYYLLRDKAGKTALSYALEGGKPRLVQSLLTWYAKEQLQEFSKIENVPAIVFIENLADKNSDYQSMLDYLRSYYLTAGIYAPRPGSLTASKKRKMPEPQSLAAATIPSSIAEDAQLLPSQRALFSQENASSLNQPPMSAGLLHQYAEYTGQTVAMPVEQARSTPNAVAMEIDQTSVSSDLLARTSEGEPKQKKAKI